MLKASSCLAARQRRSPTPRTGEGLLPSRGRSDPFRSAQGAAGRAVPVSSAMCFNTSSSDTNFTSRAPRPFPESRLMAGTLQAPTGQSRGARPAAGGAALPQREHGSAARPVRTNTHPTRLTALPSGAPGPGARAPARSPWAPGHPLTEAAGDGSGFTRQTMGENTGLPEGERGQR